MTYLKAIVLGRLGATEVWSVGLTFRNFELFPASMTQTMVESLANRLVSAIPSGTWPAGIKTCISSSASILGWRVEQHEEDEKLRNVAEAFYASPVTGTGTATKTPQDAMVVSLRTSTPGARGRGRVYWPALALALNSEFRLATGVPLGVASGTAQLAKLIGDQMNAEYGANSAAVTVELAVRSITDHTSRKVERLQAGDVLDTQRRRRDSIPETYVVQPYPPA